jgi:hypothetical protein
MGFSFFFSAPNSVLLPFSVGIDRSQPAASLVFSVSNEKRHLSHYGCTVKSWEV